jgi:hypothetical protein
MARGAITIIAGALRGAQAYQQQFVNAAMRALGPHAGHY